jgi:hypothetical protein
MYLAGPDDAEIPSLLSAGLSALVDQPCLGVAALPHP